MHVTKKKKKREKPIWSSNIIDTFFSMIKGMKLIMPMFNYHWALTVLISDKRHNREVS